MSVLHLIANFLIRKDNTILLEKKKGKWQLAGGHVLPGEDLIAATKREAKEEFGVDVSIVSEYNTPDDIPNVVSFIPLPINVYFSDVNGDSELAEPHRNLGLLFITTTNDQPEPKENQEIKLFSKEELEKETEIIDVVRNYALHALAIEVKSSR